MNKPTKPNIVIPESFAENGIKTDFDNEKLTNGFDRLQPDVLAGDNLNKLIDDTYKGLNYALNLGDYVLGKNQITNCILEAPNGVATYSGSTITVKAGLKVLIPDGRNADGTLKNIEYTLENDITKTVTTTYEHQDFIFIKNNGTCFAYDSESIAFYNKLADRPAPATGVYKCCFVAETNLWYVTSNGSPYEEFKMAKLGIYFNNASSQITNLNIDEPINLLKQSDKPQISGWGMPSNKSTSLTLGASNSKYIAPANGWFFVEKIANSSLVSDFKYMTLRNNASAFQFQNNGAYQFALSAFIPVKKGDEVQVIYNATGKVNAFKFIYAEGEV